MAVPIGKTNPRALMPGRNARKSGVFAVMMLLSAMCAAASAQDSLAIRGAHIIPIEGDEIESGTILIADGRITDIGEELEIPVDAKVIDAAGKVVMPGIINVHSSAGMSQSNEQNPIVPFLSVVDSIDPIRTFFEESRRLGVTTAAVVPGNNTMIGGRAAIVKTAGSYVDDMLVRRDSGLKISLSPVSGSSRMSHIARLRKELTEAREEIEAEKESPDKQEKDSADSKGEEEEEKDAEEEGDQEEEEQDEDDSSDAADATSAQQATENERLEAYRKLLSGKMTAIIYCPTSMDVTQALSLIEEFELKPVLVLGRDCEESAELLAKKKIPIVLDSTMVYWKTDPQTREDEQIVLTKTFSDAGVDFVFQFADSGTSLGPHYPSFQAATAVKFGMSREDALRKLTLDAARLLGVDNAVGSIEKGKDADLVILTGDPLDVTTWVETTLVNGKVVYERSEDPRIRRLFHPEEDAE